MIYQDYMRRKMHNVVKLDTAEGYPLTVYNCANKNLKDYTITGNTVYGENLFNYTEPYNDDQIKADADGWFDVTIDNTEGTSVAYKYCYTAVNNSLKVDTPYFIVTEIAEYSGDINATLISSYSVTPGQFISGTSASTTGIFTFVNKTRSSFDNCTSMLRTLCYCSAGKSGHIKFRIAIYEISEDLYNKDEPYNENCITPDEDGWYDITIDNTEGTSTAFKSWATKVNNALKPDTEYILFTEIAECTGTINVQVKTASSNSQFTGASIRYGTASMHSDTITTLSSFDNCTQMLSSSCYCGAGKLGHAKFRISVYEVEQREFLPYSKQSVGDKTENLFNYTEPYDDNQIIADENGWFDVTIDNTEGTTTKYVKFFTKPNLQLKPSKLYYVKQILETKTGNIRCDWVSNNANDLSQFTASLVDGSGYVITRSDFTNCKYMMRGNVSCTAGNTGRVKFRLMVYEASEDLYNRTEPYNEECITPDENGWYDVTINNTDGTTSKAALCFTAVNQKLKPNTKYYIYAEIAQRSGAITLVLADASNTSSYKSQFATSVTTQSNYATTRANFSDCETMLRNHCYCEAGASGHIKFRISVYEVIQKSFEPYNKYKIPILINGNEAAVIFRDAPLADGESINYKSDSLPDIVLEKGTNTITADTEVKPSSIKIKYLKK